MSFLVSNVLHLWTCGQKKGASLFYLIALICLIEGIGLNIVAASATNTAQASVALKLNINTPFPEKEGIDSIPWEPVSFFTNAAGLLLRDQMGINLAEGIQVYPTNQYSSAVHRLLQLAANIYDATTNRMIEGTGDGYPYPPSVFRPVFTNRMGAIYICSYVEVTNAIPLTQEFSDPSQWLDLELAQDRDKINNRCTALVHGVPFVIGAKKGLPNFNEFSMNSVFQLSRVLELRKILPTSYPVLTNSLYLLGISNTLGVEAWNSYTQAYPRPLQLSCTLDYSMVLTNNNRTNGIEFEIKAQSIPSITMNLDSTQWSGGQFLIPLLTNIAFIPDLAYSFEKPGFYPFSTNNSNTPFANYTANIPDWTMIVTYRVHYLLVDSQSQRVLDVVNICGLTNRINISRDFYQYGYNSSIRIFWDTNLIGSLPVGMREQLRISLGESTNDTAWTSDNRTPLQGQTREKAIDLFRVFCGLMPLSTSYNKTTLQRELANTTSLQTPFSPILKFTQSAHWQANDPLVHYTQEDLYDTGRASTIQYVVPPSSPPPTNSNLGKLNIKFRPWGGNPYLSSDSDTNAYNLAIKDSMVSTPDDWVFPTNRFPNIGWLGRVHRGTPWQTVYFKSAVADMIVWRQWSFHAISHPTNDWHLLDLFTVTEETNAPVASINQSSTAAWSAVLSPLSVLTNVSISTNSRQYVLKEMQIQANTPQLAQIINDIEKTRNQFPQHLFMSVGDLLATPSLTVSSPYLDLNNKASRYIPDEAYEYLPQQLLSHLRFGLPDILIAQTRLIPEGFQFGWTSLSGQRFEVEQSIDLKSWSPASGKIISEDSQYTYKESGSQGQTGSPTRFYRVHQKEE